MAFKEKQLVSGAISRTYDDKTLFVYHKWDTNNIYLETVFFGDNTIEEISHHIKDFINNKENKDIYSYADKNETQLQTIYSKLGFNNFNTKYVKDAPINYVFKNK